MNLKYWRGEEYTFEGTVTNRSQSQLSTLSFDLTITDCKGDTCRIVGRSTPEIRVDVPAGQTRSFSVSGNSLLQDAGPDRMETVVEILAVLDPRRLS